MSAVGYPANGELLGAYRVGRRIGGGGMGVVFEAYDEGLARAVALKVIAPHLADDEGFRARFTREAQAQASLDSAHVVHVYAHGEVDGRLYIATQLVADGDLGQMVQARGGAPVRTAVDLIAQVASGLADAHAAGLIHRDIKPANVLLRQRGSSMHAYLGDFGIARQVGADQTRTGAATVGTPSYMAPELHTGGVAGVASDIYSLGALLWATLSGQAPYAGTSDFQIVTAHLEQPVPQIDARSPLDAEVNRILRTALAKDPSDRYPSAAAMGDDLRRALLLPDTPAPVSLPGAPDGAQTGRRRLALVLAAVAVLVLAGVGTAYALTRGGDSADRANSSATTPRPSQTPLSPSSSASDPSDAASPSGSATSSGTGEATSADAKTAIDNFAGELAASSVMSTDQSDCVARSLVRQVGLPQLIDDGFFATDLTFLDPDLADLPAEKAALSQATLSCLTLD